MAESLLRKAPAFVAAPLDVRSFWPMMERVFEYSMERTPEPPEAKLMTRIDEVLRFYKIENESLRNFVYAVLNNVLRTKPALDEAIPVFIERMKQQAMHGRFVRAGYNRLAGGEQWNIFIRDLRANLTDGAALPPVPDTPVEAFLEDADLDAATVVREALAEVDAVLLDDDDEADIATRALRADQLQNLQEAMEAEAGTDPDRSRGSSVRRKDTPAQGARADIQDEDDAATQIFFENPLPLRDPPNLYKDGNSPKVVITSNPPPLHPSHTNALSALNAGISQEKPHATERLLQKLEFLNRKLFGGRMAGLIKLLARVFKINPRSMLAAPRVPRDLNL